MAKQTRKPVKSPPVTSHPLFPAVVALWFGALFGLGSLAVRPTLLENLVLKSHIDLIIPATAPPLGVTARILIALLLAALGAIIGIALARRIARPKIAEPIERKRSAKDLHASAVRYRARDAHPDAPARAPISAHEELGQDFGSGTAAPAIIAMRRRALVNEAEQVDFVPHEFAPLPGAAPQILNIAEIGLNEPAGAAPQSPDLAEFAPAAASSVPLDWANAVPASVPAAPIDVPAAILAQRQIFQPDGLAAPVTRQPVLDAAAVHADGRQVFGMAPQPDRIDEPRQIFGVVATDGHVPQDFVKAAGYQTTVFDVTEPSPLFAPRTAETASADPLPAETAAAPSAVAAALAPLPSPGDLGMTDLATRLADAMRRRRAGAEAKAEAQAQTPELTDSAATQAVAEQAVAAPIPVAVEPAPLPAAIPAAFEPAPAVPQFTALTPAAPAPVAAAPDLALHALPNAMRPLALDAFLEEDAALDTSLHLPRHILMPSLVLAAAPPLELVVELASEDEPADIAEEENYGSLLELNPVRNPFVRIDDPAADALIAEPVVIFPGQAPPSAAQAAVLGIPAAASDEGSFRRFDAPASAGQGQPLAAAVHAMPPVDPAETERSLRAALSNLQRMSGAA